MRIPLTHLAQDAIGNILRHGDLAIDATLGNGNDTVFLANKVGAQGRVFGFDIQQAALEKTKLKLRERNLEDRVILFNRGHEEFPHSIPSDCMERIQAFMFNLGYLPGGDKSLTTMTKSTLKALKTATVYLAPGGRISILAYTGHPGGRDETEAVRSWALTLHNSRFSVETPIPSATPTSPEFIVISRLY